MDEVVVDSTNPTNTIKVHRLVYNNLQNLAHNRKINMYLFMYSKLT